MGDDGLMMMMMMMLYYPRHVYCCINPKMVYFIFSTEHNKPPLADAGLNKTVWLPVDTVTLSAINSTDDQHIDSYQWTQIR